MKIILKRLDDAYHLQAKNEEGCTIETDGATAIGGSNKGMRPMQLLLATAGSCSSIDIISILKKQKQELKDLEVEVTAEREKDKVPSLFTDIHIHYKFKGDLADEKVKRAVGLSMDKYCSVVKILEKTANVSSSYEIIKL
ncbi:MAG: OsmC family protein [Cyclobacteriaceae bacterium]|nr:OsmC family protein [Cyclobacteriaceae bacterium]MCK5372107.1 OsmC family protein [Cyclobacteriaceae bacterium]MCK5469075.1 OsmC family protein [Cyclobacteriaceae bacterium]MCK5702569.1 OsmC family protein [Cyclobacteriaceae bacterium]